MNCTNRAWVEINLDAIENNIKAIRNYVNPGTKIIGTVKADAYGHGCIEVSKILLENGVDILSVACVDEAINLRENGFKCPILILGHCMEDEVPFLAENDIISACYDFSFAKALSDVAKAHKKTAKVHIKIDTGMGRIGYQYKDNAEENQKSIEEIIKISKLPNIEITGIFTHFSVADSDDDSYTYTQFNRFCDICDKLKKLGIDIPQRHCCNSAALIRFPQMHMDMVRTGIILYGEKPSEFVDCERLGLMPAMTLKAKISNIKTIEKGDSISYGRLFRADKKLKIATIPIGYADGYSRILSNKAQAIVGGKMCNIVGNICMDQCMIDVTDVNTINIGDEVILFGKGENIELPVECLAEKMGTINYEVLCMISRRVERVYYKDGAFKTSLNYLKEASV